jgi:hypothetical protein
MDDKTIKLVDAIKKEIDDLYDDVVLFRDKTAEDRLVDACLEFIFSRGYKLSENIIPLHPEIKNINDLINFFYNMFNRYHPDMLLYKNNDQDRSIAKAFVESRKQAEGISDEMALAQCVEIIKVIFENEAKFNFTMPLSFSIFGQKNCYWITEFAVRMLNDKIKRDREELNERLADEFMANDYKGPTGWTADEINTAYDKLKGE